MAARRALLVASAAWLGVAAAACDRSQYTPRAGGPDADVPSERACEAELAAAWVTNPPTTGLGSAAARRSYTDVIGRAMADFQVPGGAIAVVRDGRLVLMLGIGLADRENQQPAHADQLWRVASVSKQITAPGIQLLVDRGQLSLDDKVF